MSRKRTIAAVSAVLVLLAAALLVAWLWSRRPWPELSELDPHPPAQDMSAQPKLDQVGTDLAGRPIFSTAVHALAFSPDSTTLAAGAGDGGVLLIRLGEEGSFSMQTHRAHEDWAFALAFMPNGTLVTGGGDNEVFIHDRAFDTCRPFLGHTNDVHAVAVSSDGLRLYSTGDDRRLIAWSVADGVVIYDIKPHDEQVPAMRLTPDGSTLATGSRDDKVRLFNAADGTLLHTIATHDNDVLDLAFSPDGMRLASAGYDTTVRIHDIADGLTLDTLYGHKDRVFAVAYGPDGATLVSGGEDHDLVFYDASNGYVITDRIDTGEDISRLAFSPDGRWLAASSSSGMVTIYDTATRQIHVQARYEALVEP